MVAGRDPTAVQQQVSVGAEGIAPLAKLLVEVRQGLAADQGIAKLELAIATVTEDLDALHLIHTGQGGGDGGHAVLIAIYHDPFGVIGKAVANRLALLIAKTGIQYHQMSRTRAACPLAIALTRRSDGDLVLVASVLLLVAVSVIGAGGHGAVEQQAWLQRDTSCTRSLHTVSCRLGWSSCTLKMTIMVQCGFIMPHLAVNIA